VTKRPPTIIAEAAGVSTPRVGAAVRKRAVDEAITQMEREGVPLDSPEARDRIGRVVRGSRGEAERHLKTGTKIHWRPDKGGRRLDTNRQRNVEMAREFRKRLDEAQRRGSQASATALKQAVGKDFGLKRRAAITAINAGLKILCGLETKPHD
jgi:hypothetical protein